MSAPAELLPVHRTTLGQELRALPGAVWRRLARTLPRWPRSALVGPPPRGGRRARMPRLARTFDAGQGSRVRATWGTWSYSANAEVYSYLRTLRARSRDHARNNPYMVRFLGIAGDNVAGPHGVAFQAVPLRSNGASSPPVVDREDAMLVEAAMATWSERGNFTTDGQKSRADVERDVVTTAARDGEFLALIARGFSASASGYALAPIDPDRLDLNKNLDRDPATGLRTVMGVQLDDWNRPRGYWILRVHPDATWPDAGRAAGRPGEYLPGPTGEPPVPAEDVVHCFLPHRPEAVRGIPWAHASMTALEDLGGFTEAAVIAARYGAMRLAWYKEDLGEQLDHDTVSASGDEVVDAELGSFGRLPPGVSLEDWSPDYPHAIYEPFHASILRTIGAGLGVSYHNLGNDLSKVNFSSANVGVYAERDVWRRLQTGFLIAQFNQRLYPDWLRYQLATGQIPIPPSRQPKLERVVWRPRVWEPINRVRDATADAMLYGMGAMSLSEIIRQRGQEPEDVWRERAREADQMETFGVSPQMPSNLKPIEDEEPASSAAPEE